MKNAYFSLALFLLLSSVAFAQADPTAANNSAGSPFDKYCYDQCFAATGDEKCSSLCLTTADEFKTFCSDTCGASGKGEIVCGLGCTLLANKRADLKSCFDRCLSTEDSASCDSKCNVTSTVGTVIAAVGMATKGNMTVTRALIIEKRIGDVFPNSTIAKSLTREILVREGRMNLTEVEGKKYIRLPLGLENNEKLDSLVDRLNNVTIINDTVYIPIKSRIGPVIASIVVETGGIRGKDGVGEGEVKRISLKTEAIKAEFRAAVKDDLKETLKQPEVSIVADLNDIPSAAVVDVRNADVPENKLERFKEAAKAKGLTIKEKALAIEVIKENIANLKEITKARIKVKVDKRWLSSVGGVSGVRIVREDSGVYEILNTSAVGDEAGMSVIEGDSPNGLSLYAVVTVGVTSPTGDTGTVSTGGGINPLIIGGILVAVVTVVYLFVLRKPQKK